MSTTKSRFSSLAQAVKERTAEAVGDAPSPEPTRPTGAGGHKPTTALTTVGETLRDHITRLEAQLAQETSKNSDLAAELQRVKTLSDKAGDTVEEFLFLQADAVVDRLPKDRLRGCSEGREFDELLADIKANGQNDAVTVRRGSDGAYEVAAGRRRHPASRSLVPFDFNEERGPVSPPIKKPQAQADPFD